MNLEYSKSYLEWCTIMNQTPNERDHIIFQAGQSFALIEQAFESEQPAKEASQ